METLENHPDYKQARRHVRAVRGFYTHALVYVLVNAGMLLLNHFATPGKWWFGWSTLFWGIGLLAHGLSVFAFRGWFGPDWEARRIREYLDRAGRQ